MSKTALILLATDSEEMETVISADVLTRAGIKVTIAGISGAEPVKCSRGVVIVPDKALAHVSQQEFDVIVLPGGFTGATHLVDSPQVGQLLKRQEKSGKLIAGICAAPLAFKRYGIGLGKRITSHPYKADQLKDDYDYCEDRVVIDGQLITSRGVGTAFEFALAIAEQLVGTDKLNQITPIMILKE